MFANLKDAEFWFSTAQFQPSQYWSEISFIDMRLLQWIRLRFSLLTVKETYLWAVGFAKVLSGGICHLNLFKEMVSDAGLYVPGLYEAVLILRLIIIFLQKGWVLLHHWPERVQKCTVAGDLVQNMDCQTYYYESIIVMT